MRMLVCFCACCCRRRLLFPVSSFQVFCIQTAASSKVARPPTGIFFNGRDNRIGSAHFIIAIRVLVHYYSYLRNLKILKKITTYNLQLYSYFRKNKEQNQLEQEMECRINSIFASKNIVRQEGARKYRSRFSNDDKKGNTSTICIFRSSMHKCNF